VATSSSSIAVETLPFSVTVIVRLVWLVRTRIGERLKESCGATSSFRQSTDHLLRAGLVQEIARGYKPSAARAIAPRPTPERHAADTPARIVRRSCRRTCLVSAVKGSRPEMNDAQLQRLAVVRRGAGCLPEAAEVCLRKMELTGYATRFAASASNGPSSRGNRVSVKGGGVFCQPRAGALDAWPRIESEFEQNRLWQKSNRMARAKEPRSSPLRVTAWHNFA